MTAPYIQLVGRARQPLTRYQELEHKIRSLKGAALSCAIDGRNGMASIWSQHAFALERKRDALTVAEAEALV